MLDRRTFMGMMALGLAGTAAGAASPPDTIGDIQRRLFDRLRDTTDPRTGLAPDRWATPSSASLAATSYALAAWPVGVVNGWMPRAEACRRTLACLEFFAAAPQGHTAAGTSGYKGFFYGSLDRNTGMRFGRAALSTTDTALLLGSMLFAQSWFDRDDAGERRIRMLADQVYGAVEWDWIVPHDTSVGMDWHPETGFIAQDWDSPADALLLYVLALASPKHPVPPATSAGLTQHFAAWPASGAGDHGYLHRPSFGHQDGGMVIDRRSIDGRQDDRWGTLPRQQPAVGSPSASAMHARYDRGIYGLNGIRTGSNTALAEADILMRHGNVVAGEGWLDRDHPGSIVCGIENRRTGLIWRTMQRNRHIRRGLERTGVAETRLA